MRSTAWPGLALCAAAWFSACASSASSAIAPGTLRLQGTDGLVHALPDRSAAWTVLVFFSAGCDYHRAHDPRMRELAARYASKGVRFYAVDSEVDATLARDAREAERRAYSYPILRDQNARLSRALGAEVATYSVVLDREGRVRYRGGLDSDELTLHENATFYLRDALDDLLAGRAPRRSETTPIGCSLRVF